MSKLSPLMIESLRWIAEEKVFGFPGTRATLNALRRLGLVSNEPRVPADLELTDAGRTALANV